MGHPVDFKVVTGNEFFTALAKILTKKFGYYIIFQNYSTMNNKFVYFH